MNLPPTSLTAPVFTVLTGNRRDLPEISLPAQFQASQASEPVQNQAPFTHLPIPAQVGLGAVAGALVLGGTALVLKKHLNSTQQGAKVSAQFDQTYGNKLQAYLAKAPATLAWWDQPRWQQKSLGQRLAQMIYKLPVSESSKFVHRREFAKISVLARQAQQIDHEKFTGKEFLTYLRVEAELTQSQVTGLYQSAQYLKAALAAKRYFDQIWQVEMQYLGRKQQEFYHFVEGLLAQPLPGDEFREQLNDTLTLTLPDVVNEQGRSALKSYAKAIYDLSHYEYGLELLHQFKRYDLVDYMILRDIDALIAKLKLMDLTHEQVVLPDIILNFEAFEQLAPIIRLPQPLVTPEGFANLVHFMALEAKHQVAYQQFKQLVTVLEKWRGVYDQLQEIRRSHSPKQYRLPQEFCLKLPGENIFEKYRTVISV
jgi:hypothetical protein